MFDCLFSSCKCKTVVTTVRHWLQAMIIIERCEWRAWADAVVRNIRSHASDNSAVMTRRERGMHKQQRDALDKHFTPNRHWYRYKCWCNYMPTFSILACCYHSTWPCKYLCMLHCQWGCDISMSKTIYDASKDAVCDDFLPSEMLKDFKKEQGKFSSMAHDKLRILRVLLVCLHTLS